MEIIKKFIVEPVGRLDTNTSGELSAELASLVETGQTRLLLDFSRLEFISSAGLRALLQAAKKLSASGGRFAICAVQDHVTETLRMVGFDSLFTIYQSREKAYREFFDAAS